MTRRNLYYNYIGYPNYYAPGGNLNFQEVLEEENAAEYAKQVANQKENKFLDAMNNNGGGWASAIAPAATNIANAFLDTEASTADRVAGAMGIPVLAKQWTADTTKGNQYLKGLALQNTGIKKPNYIQDASSAWGANNAIKLNAQNNISPISSESALPSLKDFKGNWWRNTGAAVAQGAAAGSVGGPWGALGGAVTGFFGSIGGLFGRQKRANAAYKDFLARRDTLMSARQAQFNKANIDQTLSNMQALANGNTQQRINDMANIRAYGGNLYPDGGDIDPYYPESQDPTAVNWLSNWYRQRPEQLRNTFYGNTYDMPNPNMSGEYEELSDIPLDRTINPSRKFFDDSLYKNLIDRAATTSPVYRMDMPNTTLGEYNPSGQNIITEDGFVNYPNAAHTISYNMRDVPAFANPDEDYYDKETLPLRIHENNHAITHGFDSVAKEINNRIIRKDGVERDSYKDNPYEVHSYMMEFRNKAGLNPTDIITKDVLNKYRKELKETNLDRYTDDSLIDLLNNVVDNNMKRYSNVAAFGGGLDLSPNMMNLWNNKQAIDQQKVMNQQLSLGLGNSFNQKMFADGGIIPPNTPLTKEELDMLTPAEKEEYAKKQVIGLYKELYAPSPALYDSREEDAEHTYNVLRQNPNPSFNIFDNLFKPSNSGYIFSERDKRKEAAEKAQQHSGGSGGWGDKFYANGGQIDSSDLPDNAQYYANGGTHEENPYGGIQVGVDQQGNPNFVEEGEFRWGDYIFSDRINVDPTLLSRYNLAPATRHQNKKANKGKLSYADMAKKYAKKNGELANDPIGKNTLEAYMKRLQDAQEDQKFQDSIEQQKQDAINQYRNALTTPQQGNPLYGAMKYNGMGNAATQQGVNAGMSDLGQQGGGNEVLSNTNRSGNNMLHAMGGNLYAFGGGNEFPDNLLSEAYKRYRESQYPTIKNNEVTLKAKPQDFIPWVSEPDVYPVDYEYFFDNNVPTKFTGISPTGVQPYIHPGASPIDTYQYTPYKSRIGSNLPVYAPYSTYAYESNGSRIPFYLRYEPQYFKHSNRIEDNYIPIEQPWKENAVIPDRGIQGNRNWVFNDHTLPVYQSNFNSKLDTRPSYIKDKNPNSIAPAVSTYGAKVMGTNNTMYDKFGNNITLYPNGLNALNNNEYLSQLERDNPTNLIVPSGTGLGLPQDSDNGNLNLGVRDGDATTDANNSGNGQTSYGNTEDNTGTNRSSLTDGIKRDTTTTFGTAAIKGDTKQVPHYNTSGEYAMFGKGFTPMLYDWMNKTNFKYDPNQRPAYELADMGNNSTFLRTADTIGGYRAPNLMDAERMNNAAQAQGIAALQAALNVGNGNRAFAAAQTAQNAYNTQMGIGNNYATAQQVNNEEKYKTDAYNTAIDQFNANARNTSYQDNQKARQIGQQMAIDAKKAANDYILRNELYADATNRQAMDNRAANQATWTDNALNYFIAQAQKNDILNAKNNDITNPYWTDKNGVMHYIGDSGLNSAIYDAFTSDKDEWGNYAVNNGTFSGDRLKAWNALQEKYSAADLKAHPELWKSLVLQEKQERKKEAEKAELAKTDRLNSQRYAFDNNMAQLNNYRTLYGDKFTDSQWYDDLMKRYNDAANANEFNDVNNLEYWNKVIGDKLNYWQRYNTPVTANQSAYGGYINNNNKSNKREYYNYMRR